MPSQEALLKLELAVPGLRLGRGQNDRPGHWAKAHASRDRERRDLWMVLWLAAKPKGGWERGKTAVEMFRASVGPSPWRVRLTRVSPSAKGLDSDNLAASFKGVQDELAEWLGVDDGDREQVRWSYAQERGPWALKVRIERALMDGERMMPVEEEET